MTLEVYSNDNNFNYLYNNNCMQISASALCESYGKKAFTGFSKAKRKLRPNVAYNYLIKDAKKIGDFYVYYL